MTDFLIMARLYPSAVQIIFNDDRFEVTLFFADPQEFEQVHQMVLQKEITIYEYQAGEINAPIETAPDRGMIMFRTTDRLFSFWKGVPQLMHGPWSN